MANGGSATADDVLRYVIEHWSPRPRPMFDLDASTLASDALEEAMTTSLVRLVLTTLWKDPSFAGDGRDDAYYVLADDASTMKRPRAVRSRGR